MSSTNRNRKSGKAAGRRSAARRLVLPNRVEVLEFRRLLAGDQQGCSCGCCAMCGNFSPDAHIGLRDPAWVLEGERVAFDRQIDPNIGAFATPAGRWGGTATNPSASSVNGTPTVLTYSFVPDGTAIPGYNGEAPQPSNLFARMRTIYASVGANLAERDAFWQGLFHQSLNSWSSTAGITYVRETNDDGSTLAGGGTAGVLGVRGDVRIGGHRIDGNSGILAYNFFPAGGADMVIDTDDNFFNSTANNSRGLRNVVAHEAGHGLGFNHVDPTNETKLMEAFVSFAYDGPQFDDRLLANYRYGDRLEGLTRNNTTNTAANLGTLSRGTTTFATLSTSTSADVDVYRITLAETSTVRISASPIGSSYLSGEQDGPTATFNPRTVHDLTLNIRTSSGATFLSTQDNFGLGTPEVIASVLMPAGDYFITVAADSSVTTNAQMYDLGFVVSASTPAAPTLATASDSGVIGDNITSNVRPSFTGTGASPGATMDLLVDGVLVGSTIVDGGGRYTVAPTTDLAAGTRAVRVQQTDLNSVQTDPSLPLSVVIDVSASDLAAGVLAAVSDSGTSNSDRITRTVRPQITGSGAEAGATVQLFSSGVLIGTGTANGSGEYSVLPTNELSDGTYSLTVKQVDVAGNTSAGFSPSLSVTIDTLGPTIVPSAPVVSSATDTGSSNSDSITSNASPTLTGTAEPGSLVEILLDEAVVATVTANGQGLFSSNVGPLAFGTYSVTARSIDIAGNTSGTSGITSLVIDVSSDTPAAPLLAVSSDTGVPNDNITGFTQPQFTGSGVEAGATIDLLVDGVVVGSAIASGAGAYVVAPTSPLNIGTRVITVRQTDLAGNVSGVSQSLSIEIDPAAPTLQASSGVVAVENVAATVVLGTVSVQSPRTLYIVTVNWGDGSTPDTFQVGQSSASNLSLVSDGQGGFNISGTHTYQTPGTFTVTIRAEANTGGTVTATTIATVSNLAIGAPGGGIISGGFNYTFVEGTPTGPRTVAVFTDPGGTGNPLDYTVSVDWGDDTVTPGTVTFNAGTGVYTVTAQTTYTTGGSFGVVVSVTEGGSTVTAQSTSTVSNASLTIGTSTNVGASEGGTYAGRVLTFISGFSAEPVSSFSAAVDFGDGSTAVGVITADSLNPGTFIVSVNKVFADNGLFNGSVTITDDDGGSVVGTFNSEVSSVAPTGTASGPAGLYVGESYALALTGSDPSSADIAAGLTYTINWRDGTEATVVTGAPGATTAAATHVFDQPGEYEVLITVTDPDGASTSFTQIVVVEPTPEVSQTLINGLDQVGIASHVESLGFVLSVNGETVPSLTKDNLTLLHNGKTVIDLTNASFSYNGTTFTGSLDLSSLSLPDGDYQLQVRFAGGTTTRIDFSQLLGDIDGNGRVDPRDRRSALQAVGQAASASAAASRADVNGDGNVTADDVAIVRQNNGKRLLARTMRFGINARRGPALNFSTLRANTGGIIEVVLLNNYRQARGIGELRTTGDAALAVQVRGNVWTNDIRNLPLIEPGDTITIRLYATATNSPRPIVGNLSLVHANVTNLDSRRFESAVRGLFAS